MSCGQKPSNEIMSERLLLVEDDAELAQRVLAYLRKQGFEVEHVADGLQAIARIRQAPPALVILDGMLPGADGFDVLRQIRPAFTGAVLMLTARDEDLDQVLGLELGADDYVIKPAEPRVLLARVRALLRRGQGPTAQMPVQRLDFGGLLLDAAGRSVRCRGLDVALTTAEFDLLWLLASQAGRIIDRDALLRELRGIGFDGLDRSVDARISRLRRKLGDDADEGQGIKTVRGQGYLFNPQGWPADGA